MIEIYLHTRQSIELENQGGARVKINDVVVQSTTIDTLTEPFDMVFIDASHSYSLVKRDIEIALRLCRPGGTVSGHDYVQHYDDCDLEELESFADIGSGFVNGVGYGVIKAVHEAFGTPNKEGAVWWVERD